jgi:hypothetical protein
MKQVVWIPIELQGYVCWVCGEPEDHLGMDCEIRIRLEEAVDKT